MTVTSSSMSGRGPSPAEERVTVNVTDGVESFVTKEIPINDVPLAALIAACVHIKHVKELDSFYLWNGSTWWEAHDNDVAAKVVNQAIESWYKDLRLEATAEHLSCAGTGHSVLCVKVRAAQKALGTYLSTTKVSNLVKALKRDQSVSISVNDLDADPVLISFQNGVVNVLTGEWSAHKPDLLMTKQVGGWFHAHATHPDWEKALDAMSLMDEETRKWVQMYLGSGLTGYRLKDNLTVFMVGNGANGKSTILDTCAAVLGGYAGFVPKSAITGTDQEAAIARMDFKGLRLAMLDETKAGATLDTDATKSISGVTITARKLHVGNVTFKATHTFLIATNHEPYVREADSGIWRRLVKVPFDKTFKPTDPDFDPALADRLAEGRDGRAEAVLAWLLEGARMFFEAGETLLPLPAALTAATEEWATDTDLVGQFLDAECELTGAPTDKVPNDVLYEAFTSWCDLHRHETSYKNIGFSKALKAHRVVKAHEGVETYRTKSERGWTGIRFVTR